MKRAIVFFVLSVLALLTGCVAVPAQRVVYVPQVSNTAPPYPQVPGGMIAQPPVVYVQPAPVYYYPAPTYYWGPPVILRFGGHRGRR